MASPNVKQLEIGAGALTGEGFETTGFGAEYWKEVYVFSEAHGILTSLLWDPAGSFDYSHDVVMTQDHDASEFEEVYKAWREAGGEEGLQNVATVGPIGKWGVGFGGKKNGERAAKLALAISVAKDSPNLQRVCSEYPDFASLLAQCGIIEGGKWGGKGGGGKWGGGGKGGKDDWMMQLFSMMKGGGKDWGWGGDDGWGGKGAGPYGNGGKGGGCKGGGKGGGKGGIQSTGVQLNEHPAGHKVWVGGIPAETKPQPLQDYFSLSGGTVVGAAILRPGTGCVVYSSEEEAQMAIAVLNGTELDGSTLQVDVWSGK